ncbi:MAG: tRNA (N6-isopentenyl adenosine(37)-C2)-methylthiotransferase MiaB, partial [Candidatus Omnitrophica bacterium]|nr:tRNA (N6-isopentenyl adenosine(37)-C2)-methylthiotransferase MiaB [Candidatus Omnitrophota bacterium]
YTTAENESEADVILFNTCSVRQHAEDKVYSQIGELRETKKARPELVIGVMGCMVENYKTKFFSRFPYVDLLIGTKSIRELPAAIEKIKKERVKVFELTKAGFGYDLYETPRFEGKIHAYLPIMTGCDKVCSFCVVPYVRGPEISRPSKEVIEEVKRFAESGVKHVTLLGQNVNSYRGNNVGAGASARPLNLINGQPQGAAPTFADLIREITQIPGIEKISFTTSHPEDAREELFLAIRDHEKISRHFHLPLQSGSDQILQKMRRGHTLAEYRKKIDRMRELVPDVSITTDIICGFPTETEDDFCKTEQALRAIEYDDAFIFRYSQRPHTGAGRLENTVSETEKARRVTELLQIQKEISRKRNQTYVGRTFKVLIEEVSKKSNDEVLAWSWHDKKVVFPGDASEIGLIVDVTLVDLMNETFHAVRV